MLLAGSGESRNERIVKGEVRIVKRELPLPTAPGIFRFPFHYSLFSIHHFRTRLPVLRMRACSDILSRADRLWGQSPFGYSSPPERRGRLSGER